MEANSADKKTDQTRISSFKGGFYEICVQGQLDASWSDWFEGLAMTMNETGNTVLSGFVVDQAALHSILSKLHRLNLLLLSLNRIDPGHSSDPHK